MSNPPRGLLLSIFLLPAVLLLARGTEEVSRPQKTEEAPAVDRTPGTAVLESGPSRRYGIFVLPANAISHYEGVYTDGETELTVRYTEDEIIIPADWVTGFCGSEPVRFTQENGRLYYVYSAAEGWFVLFDVPEGYGKTCAFIGRYLQRLRYFKSVSKKDASAPFPAIVEVP